MYFCWICYSQYIPPIFLSLVSQMEINSQRQLSIPQNWAQQKISQQRRLKLSLNDDIFHTGWFVPTIPDFFLFEPPSKYITAQCPFNALNGCLCQKIDQRTHPNWALLCIFYNFSYPLLRSITCFSFVVCVSKDRSFEASHWRPAQHVRPPDANFSSPQQSFRLQPFSASELN